MGWTSIVNFFRVLWSHLQACEPWQWQHLTKNDDTHRYAPLFCIVAIAERNWSKLSTLFIRTLYCTIIDGIISTLHRKESSPVHVLNEASLGTKLTAWLSDLWMRDEKVSAKSLVWNTATDRSLETTNTVVCATIREVIRILFIWST